MPILRNTDPAGTSLYALRELEEEERQEKQEYRERRQGKEKREHVIEARGQGEEACKGGTGTRTTTKERAQQMRKILIGKI